MKEALEFYRYIFGLDCDTVMNNWYNYDKHTGILEGVYHFSESSPLEASSTTVSELRRSVFSKVHFSIKDEDVEEDAEWVNLSEEQKAEIAECDLYRCTSDEDHDLEKFRTWWNSIKDRIDDESSLEISLDIKMKDLLYNTNPPHTKLQLKLLEDLKAYKISKETKELITADFAEELEGRWGNTFKTVKFSTIQKVYEGDKIKVAFDVVNNKTDDGNIHWTYRIWMSEYSYIVDIKREIPREVFVNSPETKSEGKYFAEQLRNLEFSH